MSSTDKALWRKAWTETQWYFRGGLAFLLASAVALYIGYPDNYTERFPNGAIAVGSEQVRALLHDGRSYIWLSWFGTSLILGLSFLALALASTGIVRDSRGERGPRRGLRALDADLEAQAGRRADGHRLPRARRGGDPGVPAG